jgi:hypothetical protein
VVISRLASEVMLSASSYESGRTLGSFLDFLTHYIILGCGTHHMSRNDLFGPGKEDDMLALAREFTRNYTNRALVLEEAQKLAEMSHQKWLFFYVKIMERVVKEPNFFPIHEL